MASHKTAGDTISAGWTWDELATVREEYIAVFFLLSIVGTLVLFGMLSRNNRLPIELSSI